LTLRAQPGVGSEIVVVEAGSVAARAGLMAGDAITRISGITAPTPAQVRRVFADEGERPLIVAYTRGTSRRITVLDR
jgi:membrane-associated protease RseP (regulator of RpoE activity)